MSMKSRLISVLVLGAVLALLIHLGLDDYKTLAERAEERRVRKETIHLWYTDEALTDYINSVALNFYEDTDIRVVPTLVSGSEYLEQINTASLDGAEIPDLYIIGNDSLGKAYLSGLAVEIDDEGGFVNPDVFYQAGVDAVTYEGKKIAYPFYFETSYLLYNRTYLKEIAMQLVQEELNGQNAETTDEDTQEAEMDSLAEEIILTEENMTDEIRAMVENKVATMVPSTIENILDFAAEYDAPGKVESFFTWDVSDIFYNFFFVGSYVVVGGETGDDPEQVDIYNESAIRCLEMYQDMNQFFSIDADTVTYESVIDDFMNGKMIFTVATTHAISRLENAVRAGEFAYEYGVCRIPDINDEMTSRSLSTTSVVAVNGYSEHQSAANMLARYLTYSSSDLLYGRTDKFAARRLDNYPYECMYTIAQEYDQSISMPKMLETSNYWVELELCFTRAWQGEDVNLLLKGLSEKMKSQISQSTVREEYIVMPQEPVYEYDEVDDQEGY